MVVRRKGTGTLPERPFGCFAQKVPVPLFPGAKAPRRRPDRSGRASRPARFRGERSRSAATGVVSGTAMLRLAARANSSVAVPGEKPPCRPTQAPGSMPRWPSTSRHCGNAVQQVGIGVWLFPPNERRLPPKLTQTLPKPLAVHWRILPTGPLHHYTADCRRQSTRRRAGKPIFAAFSVRSLPVIPVGEKVARSPARPATLHFRPAGARF